MKMGMNKRYHESAGVNWHGVADERAAQEEHENGT
jgi:hypothetical protein